MPPAEPSYAADPDTAGGPLGEAPAIHPTARAGQLLRSLVRGGRGHARRGVGARRLRDVIRNSDITYAELGRFRSIAAGVRINPGNHPLERVALNHFTYRSSAYGLGEDEAAFFDRRRSHRATLGHDVWVGHGTVVLPGVTIGTGAAIGAGAVVSRDVPDFAVAVGVPARVTRSRFPSGIVATLHRIAWWDWPHERLSEALRDFRSLDAATFARHDPAPEEGRPRKKGCRAAGQRGRDTEASSDRRGSVIGGG